MPARANRFAAIEYRRQGDYRRAASHRHSATVIRPFITSASESSRLPVCVRCCRYHHTATVVWVRLLPKNTTIFPHHHSLLIEIGNRRRKRQPFFLSRARSLFFFFFIVIVITCYLFFFLQNFVLLINKCLRSFRQRLYDVPPPWSSFNLYDGGWYVFYYRLENDFIIIRFHHFPCRSFRGHASWDSYSTTMTATPPPPSLRHGRDCWWVCV